MIARTHSLPESAFRKHHRALRLSADITRTLRRMYWPKAMRVEPAAIIRVLNRAKIKFVLMGNYGTTGWRGEERATHDVDVLVLKSHHRKAVSALRQAFPKLEVEDYPVVTRFRDPALGRIVIDVMKPADALYQAVFKNTVMVGESHRIPDLEMALVSKYAAMISPNRPTEKKYIDAADFIAIVKHNFPEIDLPKIRRLGELIYSGGGEEIARYVDDAQAGRRLEI